MTAVLNNNAHAYMRLIVASLPNALVMELDQRNNTGGGDNTDYPNGFYGTVARFDGNVSTTPLGNSLLSTGGTSYLQLSGQTGPPNSPATKSISAVSGSLTLSYDPTTMIVTGYYNGIAVGNCSIADWGNNLQLLLAVMGGSGKGASVP